MVFACGQGEVACLDAASVKHLRNGGLCHQQFACGHLRAVHTAPAGVSRHASTYLVPAWYSLLASEETQTPRRCPRSAARRRRSYENTPSPMCWLSLAQITLRGIMPTTRVCKTTSTVGTQSRKQ